MEEPTISLPPTTTKAQDLTTQGQREVNMLWEKTQSHLAISVVYLTILMDGAVTIILIFLGKDMTAGQGVGIAFLNMICGIVISFYFSRTNHTQIGGIGPKATDTQEYKGR